MSILYLKPVPHAPDRLNILRLRRVKLNLLTDLFNMHGHRGDVADGLHVLDFRKQLFLCEYMVGILGQEG